MYAAICPVCGGRFYSSSRENLKTCMECHCPMRPANRDSTPLRPTAVHPMAVRQPAMIGCQPGGVLTVAAHCEETAGLP